SARKRASAVSRPARRLSSARRRPLKILPAASITSVEATGSRLMRRQEVVSFQTAKSQGVSNNGPSYSEQHRRVRYASSADDLVRRRVEVDGEALQRLPHQPRR